MSPDFRPPSGLSRILPKTPTSRLNSPIQTTVPAKIANDTNGKAIPIINTANPMAKTSVGVLKANALARSNSATNCTGKVNIAKPIVTNANNAKYPHSVKINNYVQSRTMPAKRNARNSPNLGRSAQSSKTVSEKPKSSLSRRGRNGDGDNHIAVSSDDEDSEVCQAKLDGIRHRANQRRQEDTNRGNFFILCFIIFN